MNATNAVFICFRTRSKTLSDKTGKQGYQKIFKLYQMKFLVWVKL